MFLGRVTVFFALVVAAVSAAPVKHSAHQPNDGVATTLSSTVTVDPGFSFTTSSVVDNVKRDGTTLQTRFGVQTKLPSKNVDPDFNHFTDGKSKGTSKPARTWTVGTPLQESKPAAPTDPSLFTTKSKSKTNSKSNSKPSQTWTVGTPLQVSKPAAPTNLSL